jgi:hypothetical protein
VGTLGDEAGDPARGVRQREEDVEHRVGAEPLVPGQLVDAVAYGLGDGRVRAQVRAPLLLGHDHPRLGEAVVVGQGQTRLPARGELGVLAHRRDGGIVDRHRAARPGVELVEEVEQGGAHDVGARPRLAPGQRVHLALDAEAQHPVHARVVLDPVAAVAVAVVGVEHGDVALGAARVLDRLRGAGHGAEVAHAVDPPAAPVALERLPERRVRIERVVSIQRRRLVDHLMGVLRPANACGHAIPPRRRH